MKKRLVLFLWATLMIGFVLIAAVPKVFVVYSYDKDYAWNSALADSLQKTLEAAECETRYFYMDTRLRNDVQWKEKSGHLALETMMAFDPDVVIACDDNAQQYFVSLIPKEDQTPIIFNGVNNDPSLYGYPNEKTTGILERPFPLESLNMCQQIVPGIKTVAFIGDDTNSTQGYIDYLKKQDLGEFQNVGFFKYERIDNLIRDVKRLEASYDVFYLIRTTEFKDAKGNIVSTKDAMEMIQAATDNPIIGLSDYIIYDGALCGIVPDPNFHGTLAAQMALKVARGEKSPSDLPVIAFRSTFNDMTDGLSIINLNTAQEKSTRVPVELINQTDVLISTMNRLDQLALDYYQLLTGQKIGPLNSYLQTLVSKPYTKNGDWPQIKQDIDKQLKYLENEQTQYRYPGIYLYIQPDGNYYSNIRNFTGVNISDRTYFSTLKDGNPVKGYPIISRSTGMKSCVFALPSFKDGQATGYAGMALYMEPLNGYLKEKMNLKDDTLYFAINEGILILSSDDSYLFSPIGDFIDDSKEAFISTINQAASGKIAFAHETGIYLGIFETQKETGWQFVYAKKIYDFSQNSTSLDMKKNIIAVMEALTKKINQMGENLLEASAIFANSEDLPEDIRGILDELYSKSPYLFDVAYVNTDLVMQYMAPEKYRELEGTDISHQEQMQMIAQTKKPQVSKLFMTVEDMYGIDVEWPVFNQSGDWKGSLSMLVEPYDFFGEIIEKNLKNTDYEIWIMQQDGTIIYDIDRHEISENLFKQGIYSNYKELQALGRQIIEEKEGHGDYSFLETGTDTPISKEAYWRTLAFHGNIWKVVITRMVK